MVSALTDKTFDEFIKEGISLIDFYADWCGPCKMMSPIIEELSKEMTGIKFGKLNVDENKETAMKYGVMSIPTFIIFKDGEYIDAIVGGMPKEVFKEILENIKEKLK